jgi:hypothetical protein
VITTIRVSRRRRSRVTGAMNPPGKLTRSIHAFSAVGTE